MTENSERTQTLADWLLACIAEDEAKARDYLALRPGSSLFFAGHSPARVLAECEAKRRIVEDCRDALKDDDPLAMFDPDRLMAQDHLKCLALPYADRDGWREEWKP